MWNLVLVSIAWMPLVSLASESLRIDGIVLQELPKKRVQISDLLIPRAWTEINHQHCQGLSGGWFMHPSLGRHRHQEESEPAPALQAKSETAGAGPNLVDTQDVLKGEICPTMGGSFCVQAPGKPSTTGPVGAEAIVIVLDVSNSMQAVDPGQSCYRKQALLQMIDSKPGRQFGMVIFDHQKNIRIPAEDSVESLKMIKEAIQKEACREGFGTDVPSAIQAGKALASQAKASGRRLLVITDPGEVTDWLKGTIAASGGTISVVPREQLSAGLSKLLD